MHGHWRVEKAALQRDGIEASEAVNMGVSIVVPAHKIKEILYQAELADMRNKVDAEISSGKSPVWDTELLKRPVFTKDDFETALKRVSRKVENQK